MPEYSTSLVNVFDCQMIAKIELFIKYLGIAFLAFPHAAWGQDTPPTAPQAEEEYAKPERSEVVDGEVFIATIYVYDKKLVSVQLVWVPPKLVSGCMGRSARGCEEYEYAFYSKPMQNIPVPKRSSIAQLAEDRPTRMLRNWVNTESAYGYTAEALLAQLSAVPVIADILAGASPGVNFQHSMEPLQVRHSIHARLRWEWWYGQETFSLEQVLP